MDKTAWRLPAHDLEVIVATIIADHLEERARQYDIAIRLDAERMEEMSKLAMALAEETRSNSPDSLRPIVENCVIAAGQISIRLVGDMIAGKLGIQPDQINRALLKIKVPFKHRRRGVEMKLLAGDMTPKPDPVLIKNLHLAHRWLESLKSGTSLRAIARRENLSESFIRSRLSLAFLSPTIQKAILRGRQLPDLTVARIIKLGIPSGWTEQDALYL